MSSFLRAGACRQHFATGILVSRHLSGVGVGDMLSSIVLVDIESLHLDITFFLIVVLVVKEFK